MLSPIEKLVFVMLTLFALGATYVGFLDVYHVIKRGEGDLSLKGIVSRVMRALREYLLQTTTLKTRKLVSVLHWGVVLGFTLYFLVNALDVLIGMVEGFDESLYNLDGFGAVLFDGYRLLADVFSVVVIVGVAYFILRRLALPNRSDLTYHDNVLLHPKVAAGGQLNDSMIVAIFILLHVGTRFLGESVYVAQHGADVFMPFSTLVSPLFGWADGATLTGLSHLMWWLALGAILLFFPYFPYTKHLHLMMAPVNYLTRPKRTSLGEMTPIDFEDEDREQFGAGKIEDLPMTQILDAFACIQCNRCQDVCPAYVTGKELSPSALEVNKRYYINQNMTALANGEESVPMIGSVISESAVWACTSCAACIDICPTGNEPMLDILDIRRNQVLMEADFPEELAAAFNGMERQGNPWGINESRFAWAEGLDVPVPTVEENPDFDILYWVGCAASHDDRAKNTARSLVKVMNAAGVNFAVLGDAARIEAVKKGTAYMNVWMYTVREFEDAIDDCTSCTSNCNEHSTNSDSVHAWDEGVAFYTGSLEGTAYGGDGAGKRERPYRHQGIEGQGPDQKRRSYCPRRSSRAGIWT